MGSNDENLMPQKRNETLKNKGLSEKMSNLEPHRPRQTGSRFSANAFAPSIWSSLE